MRGREKKLRNENESEAAATLRSYRLRQSHLFSGRRSRQQGVFYRAEGPRLGCQGQGQTQQEEVADLMSSWRGINLPAPRLHDYRHMLICHILHTFGGINVQHNNHKERLHTHGCILQLFDSEWRRRPNIGTIINISVKLCIQAAFYFPLIHLHTVGPFF